MKFILIVAVMSCLYMYTNQEHIERLEDVLAYGIEKPKKTKREVEESKTSTQSQFLQFVEEQLIQHTQALERILKTTANNEELLQALIEHFLNNMDQPKMPEKIEVHVPTRRTYNEDSENPLVMFGKGFSTYGSLLKDIIIRRFETVETPKELDENSIKTRRDNGRHPIMTQGKSDRSVSPWCSIAVLCHKKFNPICGFDDNFGYGKFDDLCHMLQVNCYWKYNFALVPSCRPMKK
ncbi:uncharacterized protein LOC110992412 [Pieris rapae]|uniref:uncharacterized protein LOC110992412 n=1 Tax=Pieris rapae TaxID=64459 RepID=UPI001E27C687|nr:uncharacterized protein LOC110992412 [Pieris rapae]